MKYLGVIARDLAPELVDAFAGLPGGEVHAWTETIGYRQATAYQQLPPGITPEHAEWPEVLAHVERAFKRLAAEA